MAEHGTIADTDDARTVAEWFESKFGEPTALTVKDVPEYNYVSIRDLFFVDEFEKTQAWVEYLREQEKSWMNDGGSQGTKVRVYRSTIPFLAAELEEMEVA